MKITFFSDHIYILKCLLRLYMPDVMMINLNRNLSPPRSTYQCIGWFLDFISTIYTIFMLEPILNCFSLYLGGRKNFGRTLIALVLTYLCLILCLLYTVLIPRRLFILNSCYLYDEYNSSKCSLRTEGTWFLLHFTLSHLIVANVYFHYLSAVLINPGNVPQIPYNTSSNTNTTCSRCFLSRPKRAHHCAICKTCILYMDHHCPWTANCIGLYTHRHFYLALIFMSIGGIYLLNVGWSDFRSYLLEINQNQINITVKYSSIWFSHNTYLPSNKFFIQLYKGCFIFSAIAVPLVIALCAWHTYLISNGETSIERHINAKFTKILRQRGVIYRNPHDFGIFLNWIKFLCLIDKHEMANYDIKKKSYRLYFVLCKRFFNRILLPSYHKPYDDGFNYELNLNTAESVLESLSESGIL
uniref:Palmitoyltransferase n=1 Tax=Schistosoma mansoni TaxID=6183 RepID=A0A3Q0KNF9_SCHMA